MLQNEVDTVRQDNIKLYEKIKFLQSYPAKVSYLYGNTCFDSLFWFVLIGRTMASRCYFLQMGLFL